MFRWPPRDEAAVNHTQARMFDAAYGANLLQKAQSNCFPCINANLGVKLTVLYKEVMIRATVLVCVGALAGLGQAASPEATVTSETPFRLRGAFVPVAGVPSWPLLAGDEIATDRSAAAIRFSDGSSVTLRQNSTARLEQVVNDVFIFRLLSGTMDVKPTSGSTVSFYSQSKPLDAPAGQVTKASVLKPMAAPPPPPPPPGHPPPPPPVSRK